MTNICTNPDCKTLYCPGCDVRKTDTTKAAHTPGPWKVAEWSCRLPTTIITDTGIVIAECSGHGRLAHESIGDARLIATALELLESLEAFVALANFDADTILKTTEEWDAMVAKAEAAIEKARGGQ